MSIRFHNHIISSLLNIMCPYWPDLCTLCQQLVIQHYVTLSVVQLSSKQFFFLQSSVI